MGRAVLLLLPTSLVAARKLQARRREIESEIETTETRVAEIDEIFCRPGYYEDTNPDEVGRLQKEREELSGRVEILMAEWESTEQELERLS